MPDTIRTPPGGIFTLARQAAARLGFGAMQLTGSGRRTPPDRNTALAILRRALDSASSISTQLTPTGVANELIGAALQPYPDNLFLASKVGAEESPERGRIAARAPQWVPFFPP